MAAQAEGQGSQAQQKRLSVQDLRTPTGRVGTRGVGSASQKPRQAGPQKSVSGWGMRRAPGPGFPAALQPPPPRPFLPPRNPRVGRGLPWRLKGKSQRQPRATPKPIKGHERQACWRPGPPRTPTLPRWAQMGLPDVPSCPWVEPPLLLSRWMGFGPCLGGAACLAQRPAEPGNRKEGGGEQGTVGLGRRPGVSSVPGNQHRNAPSWHREALGELGP